MSNNPNPVVFARYSYYLAFASSIIMFIAFILMLPIIAFEIRRVLINIIWLSLLTAGVGAFLAYAARADFRRNPGPAEAVRQARIGWRVNVGALAVVVVMGFFYVVIQILTAPQ